MDWQLVLQYAWVVLVLIALEGLLSADNALVLAVMVKHLPGEQQKKASADEPGAHSDCRSKQGAHQLPRWRASSANCVFSSSATSCRSSGSMV